jgi:hypothetical protein
MEYAEQRMSMRLDNVATRQIPVAAGCAQRPDLHAGLVIAEDTPTALNGGSACVLVAGPRRYVLTQIILSPRV